MTLEFSSQLDYALALLPECVLSLAAIVILLADVFQRGRGEGRSSSGWIFWSSALALLLAIGADLVVSTFHPADRVGMIAVDGFRVAAGLVILGGALLALLFSHEYLEREEMQVGEYYVLFLFATVGMLLLVAARDLIVVFLGLELMSISAYLLTGFNRRDSRSAEAGLKYFLIGAFASAFFLYGIALLFGATGSTNLALVAAELARGARDGSGMLLAGTALLVVGFGFKMAAVPFHMWTPDAYEGAPTPVTGFMAAGVKAAAFLAMIRIVTVEMHPAQSIWHGMLWWLAMLTMIVPNLIALAEENVKRMLAYSSVAHAGYLLVGVVAANALGRAAALFYLSVYALMTIGAFAVVYVVAGKGDEKESLDDYRGLGWRRPALGIAMTVFLLSLAGFPPTGGFVGKLFLLRSAVDAGQVTLAVTLVLSSVLSYYYYLRVVWKMYFEEAEEGAEVAAPERTGWRYRIGAIACTLGVLLGGLLPGAALHGFERAGKSLRAPRVAPAGPANGGERPEVVVPGQGATE